MYVVAMKIMRDNDEAADVVQTCMTRIWEQRSSIPLPEDPAAWCNVVARREALNRLRNRPAAALEYTPEPDFLMVRNSAEGEPGIGRRYGCGRS